MKQYGRHRSLVMAAVASLMTAGFVFAGGGIAAPVKSGEPHVVVSIKPIHSLVVQLMDGVGTPALLVEGAASPHTFTLRPSQAADLHNADVFVRVSEQVEPFTRKIAGSLDSSVRVVTLADTPGLTLFPVRQSGTFDAHTHDDAGGHDHAHDHASHDDGHGHDDGHAHHGHDHSEDHDHGKNPKTAAVADAGTKTSGNTTMDGHIWLDPTNAVAIVTALQAVLTEIYPAHKDRFAANAAATIAALTRLQNDLSAELKPVAGKSFIVFHDATQYFERRFGVEAVGAITLSPDVKPGARRLTDVRRRIEALAAPCVFAEPGFQPKLLAAVTEGTDAKSGTLDAEGLTVSPGRDAYADIMRGIARSLKTCLAS